MTRRDWWIGVGLIVAALLAHAAFPRFEWQPYVGGRSALMLRVDRWTGTAILVKPGPALLSVEPLTDSPR